MIMTTKRKIIVGFLAMILLTGGTAFLGYTALQLASDGFTTYRGLARFNVATSDLCTSISTMLYKIGEFTQDRKPSTMDGARAALDSAARKVKESSGYATQAKTIGILQEAAEDIKVLGTLLDALQKNILVVAEQYSTVVQPNMAEMQKALLTMSEQAKSVNNVNGLASISTIWNSLALTRSALSRYSESRESKDAALIKSFLAETDDALKNLGATITTDAGRMVFAACSKTLETLSASFGMMTDSCTQAQQASSDLNMMTEKILKSIFWLSGDVASTMDALGPARVMANETAQRQMLAVGGLGLFFGIAFALFIVYGIVRVLHELGVFAGAIAQGDFAYQVRIKEKGEVGQMVASLKRIPMVLQEVVSLASATASRIQVGCFRERLNTKLFNGSYGELAVAVNTIGDAYTKIFDALPIPFMAADKNYTVNFFNTVGQRLVGGNTAGALCKDCLKAPECGQASCFGKTAMETGKDYAAETTLKSQGKDVYMSITAVPLFGVDGKVAGFFEMLTDLTEIRAQQQVMRHVADDASEISNRVAAASEELSAQVEQVSRGAEMQRSRIESTASAMSEMNSTVLEVARNAGHASEQSDKTKNKANDGSTLVGNVVKAIRAVETTASTMQVNIKELGQQAESIGGVMNVISDIADQTNLLALNAAIEAARAGEAGRGFAVVADEVRKLAEKTMTATHEVGGNITAIQESTKHTVSAVGEAVKAVQEATTLAEQSGQALDEIVEFAATTSSAVASIATAAEEQSATSEEINWAVEEISQVIGENTDGMVQASAAVQELSRMAQELHRVMESLKSNAKK